MSAPAAMSHGLRSYSQKPSARAHGHVAAVDGRRAVAPDAVHGRAQERREHRELPVERLAAVVGEAGDEQRVADRRRIEVDADGLVVA